MRLDGTVLAYQNEPRSTVKEPFVSTSPNATPRAPEPRSPRSSSPRADGPTSSDGRTTRILAKTLHRELKQSGLDGPALLAVTTELLALVAEDLREN